MPFNLVYPMDVHSGKGRIEVILGPMFSGKTTELIRRITRFRFANLRCIVIKYASDTRYSGTEVVSHDSHKISACVALKLNDQLSKALQHDVIGIDEGQFFPDIVEFSEKLANNGKIVVVAALDGTFQRTAFGDILKLVPLAENVIKLTAVCMSCFRNASFTKRISNENAVEVIGGFEKYKSVCRECFNSSDISSDGSKRKILEVVDENVSPNRFPTSM